MACVPAVQAHTLDNAVVFRSLIRPRGGEPNQSCDTPYCCKCTGTDVEVFQAVILEIAAVEREEQETHER